MSKENIKDVLSEHIIGFYLKLLGEKQKQQEQEERPAHSAAPEPPPKQEEQFPRSTSLPNKIRTSHLNHRTHPYSIS